MPVGSIVNSSVRIKPDCRVPRWSQKDEKHMNHIGPKRRSGFKTLCMCAYVCECMNVRVGACSVSFATALQPSV